MTDETTPPPSGQQPSGGFDFNRPTVIALLYIFSFATGISGIVGVILAYSWRKEAMEPWEESHYTYLIRTFWIALAGTILGMVLMIVLVGVLVIMAAAVQMLVRSVFVMVNAQKKAPMPHPETLVA